ncbi:MAG: sialate O-acetylesterase [Thermoguttaceae bacterium]|jgi:alpha-galactosidase|nr:sialate O-acetylesterase [Thermoguttaceae bacterium]
MAKWWKALVLAVLLSACPAWAGDGNGKVKVFILAGQSNMEGFGHIRTLAHLGDDPQYGGLLKKIRNDDGSWVVRDDVFVYFRGGKTTGPLSVGFGAYPEFVGPELMFGVVMGDAFTDPVLLIKTAWGGKDLHFDFRPPGAGKLPYPIDPEAFARRGGEKAVGDCYRKMVAETRDCLDNMGRYFPKLSGKPYEIVGFVWFQGWNEMFASKGIPFDQIMVDYPVLYATMILDLEKEFGLNRLPSVVGELGIDGEKAQGKILELRKAQAAIADRPELKGKVRFVRTAQYWDPKLEELQAKERAIQQQQRGRLKDQVAAAIKDKLVGKTPREQIDLQNKALDEAVRSTPEYKAWQAEWDALFSHWPCHYYGSGRTYCLIGYGLGEAMKELGPP